MMVWPVGVADDITEALPEAEENMAVRAGHVTTRRLLLVLRGRDGVIGAWVVELWAVSMLRATGGTERNATFWTEGIRNTH